MRNSTVPALVYPAAMTAFFRAAEISARCRSSTAGDGDSSSSF
jgi:hypothetical protein